MTSSPKGELANQIAPINADLLGLLGLSKIECRGRHENEQPKIGPKGERLGRSESNYADFTDSSAFLGSLSRQVKSMCYLKVNI